MAATTNDLVADRLIEMASLLEHRGAHPFRIRACRRAAAAAALPDDVADGRDGDARAAGRAALKLHPASPPTEPPRSSNAG